MISGHGFELSDLNPFNYEACIGDYCTDLETIGETAFYEVPKAVFVDAPVAAARGLATAATTTADFFETVTSRDFWNYYIDEPSRITGAFKELSIVGKIAVAIPFVAGAVLAVLAAPAEAAAAAATALGLAIVGGSSAGCGGSGTGTDGALDFHGFMGIQECREFRLMSTDMHGPAPADYDSDGDGISDNDEDLDRDCECDPMETCWYWADTDADGIADGVGREKNCITAADVVGPDYVEPVACPAGSPYDVDGDGFANALDPDADNDGRFDYEEDRNVNYIENGGGTLPTTGVLYHFESVFSYPVSYTDDAGVVHDTVTCDLGARSLIGVIYALYAVQYESDGVTVHGEPQRLGTGYISDDDAKVELLVCKSELLASDANFNGRFDAVNEETNMEDPDTDGDGWCDGNNMPWPAGFGMCPVEGQYNDDCPTTFDISNICSGAGTT